MSTRSERSYSIKLKKRRSDGTERVPKFGHEDPATCNHRFIRYEHKPDMYRERCPRCGKYREVSKEVKAEIGWTCIPQKTLQNIIQVGTKVRDWKKFRPVTVQKILKNEKSAAWSYYAALNTILNVKKGKKKGDFYIQPKTLRKLVALFEKLNCEDSDWQAVRSTLKSSFGKCSRETAKIYQATMMHLNAMMACM